MTKPPSLAEALLIHLTRNVGLAGDLAEEVSAGQSGLWYWRQVVGAIVSHSWSDVRNHKLATLRAIVLGFSFVAFMARYVMWDALHYDEWLFERGVARWFYTHGYGLPQWAGWPLTALVLAASGWIVGRVSGRARLGAVIAYAVLNECVLCALGVWRLLDDGVPSNPVAAVLTVAVLQSLATTVPALIAGLCVKAGGRKRVVA